MSAPRNEEWSFAPDVDLLWSAVIEVCGGNQQTEIKAVYRRAYREKYGHEIDESRRKA